MDKIQLPLAEPAAVPSEMVYATCSEGSYVIDLAQFSPTELVGVAAFLRAAREVTGSQRTNPYAPSLLLVDDQTDESVRGYYEGLHLLQQGICGICAGTGRYENDTCFECHGTGVHE